LRLGHRLEPVAFFVGGLANEAGMGSFVGLFRADGMRSEGGARLVAEYEDSGSLRFGDHAG
jgi:hypothetical protein